MKHILFGGLLLLSFALSSPAQSYLGKITKQVNLREGPSKDDNILRTLKRNSKVFIISIDRESDFYNVIDIETNTEGYVAKSFVKVGQEIKASEGGIFNSTGETTASAPEIQVFNNTSRTLTLKLDDEKYIFSPQEKRNIILSAGTVSFRASAPGVIPYYGTDELLNNQGYSWQFYIVTRRY